MGYIAHRTVVVTGHDTLGIVDVHAKAVEIFSKLERNIVSELMYGTTNLYMSFFIAPDGSKEDWKDSDDSDLARNEFLQWLKKQEVHVNFVVVRFGGDEPSECKIEKYNHDGDEE